jgi:hypothetical protein
MTSDTEAPASRARDRRDATDRRRRLLHALFVGGLTPRRRAHRRDLEGPHPVLDLHEARWLAVAMLIMLLSVGDAILTVRLMELGAVEVNPLMALLLDSGSSGFAYLKVALTALGVVVLTVMARLHAFGRIPVSLVLYLILGLYCCLITYEFWLLETLQGHS